MLLMEDEEIVLGHPRSFFGTRLFGANDLQILVHSLLSVAATLGMAHGDVCTCIPLLQEHGQGFMHALANMAA